MTEIGQVYRCDVCGNIVAVLCAGPGELVCCEVPMELLEAKQGDVGPEKHIPIIEGSDDGIKVKVGEVPHPMEENHYIQWVELSTDNQTYIQFLEQGDEPEANFPVKFIEGEEINARSYCNIHGLWKSWDILGLVKDWKIKPILKIHFSRCNFYQMKYFKFCYLKDGIYRREW